MKAAVVREVGKPFVIEDVTLQAPRTGEVLVRIAAAGVCHSDWHVITGALPYPLPVVSGHEGAGVVEAVGDGVTRVKPGDHIILSFAPGCDSCFYCLRDRPGLCETFIEARRSGTMLDGTTRLQLRGETAYHFSCVATFAERAVVPQEACVPIRRDVPLKIAALIGCGVTTGVGAAMNTVQIRPDDNVVVYGCGGVGLNIVQGAALSGAKRIIAVDRVPAKLEMAKAFGATHTVLAGADAVETIRKLTDERGADYAFEAIGIPAVQEEAYNAVRPGGTVVLVGLAPADSFTRFPGAFFTRQEKRVIGSYYGSANPRRDFDRFLELYLAGKLKLEELITREYQLDEINAAYEALLEGEIARGVIVFE